MSVVGNEVELREKKCNKYVHNEMRIEKQNLISARIYDRLIFMFLFSGKIS